MRKLIVFGTMLACASVLIGCGKKKSGSSSGSGDSSGNPYEKMVQEFCTAAQKFSSALDMCGDNLLGQLHLYEVGLQGSTDIVEPDVRAFFAALAEAKDPVKTKVVKTVDLKDEDVQGAFIAATCDGVTIYFGVGREGKCETKKEVKIRGIIGKEEMEGKIRQIEEEEKREWKAGRTKKKSREGRFDSKSGGIKAARALIKNVDLAVKCYNIKHGKYPDSLDVLTQEQADDEDPLLEGTPVDPWGNDLRYEKPAKGKRLMIISNGPDGEPDTDDDITN